MEFRIADTFTDSLARLTGERAEGRQDDRLRPAAQPGQSRHEVSQARQGEGQELLVGARECSDIRLIVHKTPGSLLLCYVDHHDKAYDWAERRKLETHPKTGAAQLVEIRETVEEITVPVYVEVEMPKPAAAKEATLCPNCRRRFAGLRRAAPSGLTMFEPPPKTRFLR